MADNIILLEALPSRETINIKYGPKPGQAEPVVFNIADQRDWRTRDYGVFTKLAKMEERNQSLRKTGKGAQEITPAEMDNALQLFRVLGANLADDEQRREWDDLRNEEQRAIFDTYNKAMKARAKSEE